MKINNWEISNDEIIELNQLYFLKHNMIEKINSIQAFGSNILIKKSKKLFFKASEERQDEVLNQNIFIPINFECLLGILKS